MPSSGTPGTDKLSRCSQSRLPGDLFTNAGLSAIMDLEYQILDMTGDSQSMLLIDDGNQITADGYPGVIALKTG